MSERATLRGAIEALLHHPEEGSLDRTLAQSILGTADVETIAARVEGYVRDAFGSRVRECLFFTQSVSAVWGLVLESGERVVLKSHAIATAPRLRGFGSLGELEAVYEAQARMAETGFPCAAVVRRPRAWPSGAVAAMSLLPSPRGDDPHEVPTRRAMAELLASSAELAREAGVHELASLPRSSLPVGSLLPPPHNALFRFDLPAGEWIDARASAARAVLEERPERGVVQHTDVSNANVRVVGGEVVAVFDMDSIALIDEMRGVASAAVHFTYRGEPPWTWPSREESIAFVDDYVRARGRPLDRREKRRLDAAAIYAIAYSARCELSLPGEPGDGMRRALRAAPDAYFG